MPRPKIEDIRLPDETIGRCPCGFEAVWRPMMVHRRGWRTRPTCRGSIQWRTAEGVIIPTRAFKYVAPPSVVPTPPDVIKPLSQDAVTEDAAKASPATHYYVVDAVDEVDEPSEISDAEHSEDAEILARRLQEQLLLSRQGGGPPLNGDGLGGGEGDFYPETPAGAPHISVDRITVSLPIQAYLMYDYAKLRGWRRADGSFSAFIWDMVFTMWRYGLQKAIVVADVREVGLDTE